ncbi:MAG: hypothetical protein ACOC3W_06725 [Thermodesulfobacteriota bacterium]
MSSSDLMLHVEDTDPATAAQVAGKLADLMKAELGERPEPVKAAPVEVPGVKADPIAVAALILAIPPSLLAAVNLVDRAQKTEKIQKLIEWVRNQKQTYRNIRFKLVTPKGAVIQFDMSSGSEIQEIAAEARIMKDESE